MDFKEWLNNVIDADLLCGNYQQKTIDAQSKLHLMNVVLDANGASYLPEMQSKGYALPYDTIKKEFGKYINGRYKASFKNEKGNGYTSCIYCDYNDDIEISTTCTTLLGCKCKVMVKPFKFVQIYADKNCDIEIVIPESSRVKMDYWCGAKIAQGGSGRIDLKKH